MIAGFRRERLSPAIISGWEKATRECNNLLELIQQKKISKIYYDEYTKNLFKFDRIRYLAIYKHG